MRWTAALPLLLLLLIMSCGEEQPAEDRSPVQGGYFADTLYPLDSIGVEMGDPTLMFGHIASVVPIEGGRLAVLDQIASRVSVFSDSGEFLYSFGRHGEGPGELLRAADMTVMPDGDLLIHDSMGRQLERFTPEGELVEYAETGAFARYICFTGFSDSSFIGYCFDVPRTEEGFSMGYTLAEFSTRTGEPLIVHFRDVRPVGGGGEPDFSRAYNAVAAQPGNRLFISPMVADAYEISVHDSTGLLIHTIRKDAEAVRIDEENDVGYMMPVFAVNIQFEDDEDAGGVFGHSDPDMRPFVASMSVDADGNVWARRGTENRHVWDVFSPEGDHVGEVLLAGVPIDETVLLHLNHHGIAASVFYPEDYPRVYLLERPDWVSFE